MRSLHVPLEETIDMFVNRAFKNNWFNETHNLNIQRHQLTKLLEISTMNQLFQFNGHLYEQVDGVAMGSPFGPLIANTFMCHLESKLTLQDKFPTLHRRYVDDTLVIMPDVDTAKEFVDTLNGLHESLHFTMVLPVSNMISFIGMELIKNGTTIETKIYRKPTDTGLLLHFQSHTDLHYKESLIRTMLHRARALPSTDEYFHQEVSKLRIMFTRLAHPISVINSAINKFLNNSKNNNTVPLIKTDQQEAEAVLTSIPYKYQKSAYSIRRQMKVLSNKIGVVLQPISINRKVEEDLKLKEVKPPVINRQCVVYISKCGSCDAN